MEESNMTRLIHYSRVDPDGILRLAIPVGVNEADREMQVTIESANHAPPRGPDYMAWLDSVAGRWEGEFERMPQGSYETRDAL
jgi:hypothetical protein